MPTSTPAACPLFPTKARYATPAAAGRDCERLRRKGKAIAPKSKARLQIFHCPACDGWHLGHRARGRGVASQSGRWGATS